jgi:hypothetical protein
MTGSSTGTTGGSPGIGTRTSGQWGRVAATIGVAVFISVVSWELLPPYIADIALGDKLAEVSRRPRAAEALGDRLFPVHGGSVRVHEASLAPTASGVCIRLAYSRAVFRWVLGGIELSFRHDIGCANG